MAKPRWLLEVALVTLVCLGSVLATGSRAFANEWSELAQGAVIYSASSVMPDYFDAMQAKSSASQPGVSAQQLPFSEPQDYSATLIGNPVASENPVGPSSSDMRFLDAEFQRGGASWYGPQFHGRRTASGERFDMHALTAAHPTLPFGTRVRVRSLVNGREVEVRITDRGPYSRGRIIDLSRAAAVALDMLGLGIKAVALVRLGAGNSGDAQATAPQGQMPKSD